MLSLFGISYAFYALLRKTLSGGPAGPQLRGHILGQVVQRTPRLSKLPIWSGIVFFSIWTSSCIHFDSWSNTVPTALLLRQLHMAKWPN
jgi:hypothetical protein